MSALIAAGITAAAALGSAAMSSGMLSGGKGGAGGTSTQSSQVQIPGGILGRDEDNWDLAVQTANQLKDPYSGNRVASMTPEQQELIRKLYANVGSTDPAFAQAGAATNALMGYNPSMVTPQMLRDTNLQPYMSPYTQSVIDPTMKLMEQSRRQALSGIGDAATGAKAFGGSRHGIAEGVTNAQSELQKGQFAGGLWNQNFLQGQAAATGDIQRDLLGQQSNQTAGLQGAQFRGNMANQLANLSTQQQNNWLTSVQAAMGGQQMLTAEQQAKLDAERQLYMEQRQQPLDVLQIRQNALSQSPYGQTTMQQGPGPTSNPWMTGLGAGAATAGILGQMGMWNKPTPTPVDTNAVMRQAIPQDVWSQYGVASDRRLKTDIKKVGRDKATDIDLYAYRYKGDPKHYPLVVGPMAQDVKKKYPEAVFKAGDYLGIKTNFLSGMAA